MAPPCLPTELWLRVFKHYEEIERTEENGTIHLWDEHWQKLLTLICRQWLAPAKQVLYENIAPRDYTQLVFTYASLVHINPSNGNLVRSFDITDLYLEAEDFTRVQTRLLEMMPNLRTFRTFTATYGDLSRLQCFKSMENLYIWAKDDNPLYPDIKHFFPNMTILTLKGSTTQICCGNWANETLWSVKHLRLICTRKTTDLWAEPPDLSQPRLLPRLPFLEKLTMKHWEIGLEAPDGGLVGIKLLLEVSATINHLVLHFDPDSPGYQGVWMSKLVTLEKLTCIYERDNSKQKPFGDSLPPNLTELTFQWCERPLLATSLLQKLRNSSYLPKLRACPRLHFENYTPLAQVGKRKYAQLLAERDETIRSLERRDPALQCWQTGRKSTAYYQTILPRSLQDND